MGKGSECTFCKEDIRTVESSSETPTTTGRQGTASQNHDITLRATVWLRPEMVGQTGRLDSYVSLVGEVRRLWENSLAVPRLLNRVITRPAIPLQPKRRENVPHRNAVSRAAFCVTVGTMRNCREDEHTVARPYHGNYAATRAARHRHTCGLSERTEAQEAMLVWLHWGDMPRQAGPETRRRPPTASGPGAGHWGVVAVGCRPGLFRDMTIF